MQGEGKAGVRKRLLLSSERRTEKNTDAEFQSLQMQWDRCPINPAGAEPVLGNGPEVSDFCLSVLLLTLTVRELTNLTSSLNSGQNLKDNSALA